MHISSAPPSTIWRNISYTILPLIFGLTIYTLCNIEAVEMFKRMRDPRLIENPIAMNMLRTFYGKKSKPKSMDLKDADKENLNVNNLQENTFEDQN